ncbi:hypothetical protein [Catellatospora sp. NPDC049609]|uniref:hypothetical protein n=1 Tax=Catellatospora sp. NPDC049609 TaxID=3155505 RepID=UPI003440E246
MPLRPMRPSYPAALAAVCLAGAALLSGCGVPPELQPTPGGVVPQPSVSPVPASLPPSFTLPTLSAPPSGRAPFNEAVATACLGQPSADQVIAAVRKKTSILPGTGNVTVVQQPMCAGTWQYTIVSITDREPLQIVTKGAPTALQVVTAGTDICTIEVRHFAPPGIRIAAAC